MSQQLVERFLAAIDAWNRGDLETWLDQAADEWQTTGTFPASSRSIAGARG